MGGKIVVPEADMNINRVVKAFKLTPKDISDFWKLFQRWVLCEAFMLIHLVICDMI
jgi:hypothetical protein